MPRVARPAWLRGWPLVHPEWPNPLISRPSAIASSTLCSIGWAPSALTMVGRQACAVNNSGWCCSALTTAACVVPALQDGAAALHV